MNLFLESHEALVLIEFLLRYRDNGKLEIQHRAEEQILYDLCALLESDIPELLSGNYKKLLQAAREKVLEDFE